MNFVKNLFKKEEKTEEIMLPPNADESFTEDIIEINKLIKKEIEKGNTQLICRIKYEHLFIERCYKHIHFYVNWIKPDIIQIDWSNWKNIDRGMRSPNEIEPYLLLIETDNRYFKNR